MSASFEYKGVFQSTHSCRVRRVKAEIRIIDNDFNPRTRVECDSRSLV